MKGIFGITPSATQRTTSQAHKHGGQANQVAFALQGVKYFVDFELFSPVQLILPSRRSKFNRFCAKRDTDSLGNELTTLFKAISAC